MLGMCVQNFVKIVIFPVLLAVLAVLMAGCGPIDSLFNSSGYYKINIQVNDIPIDECSFIRSSDRIRPYFEHSVSKDRDISALIVFLKDPMGEIAGWKVIYQLDVESRQNDSEDDNEDITESGIMSYQEEIRQGIQDETQQDEFTELNDPSEDNQNEANETEDDQLAEVSENADSTENETSQEIPAYLIPAYYKNGDELIIPVKNLDNLPLFPIPQNLPMGDYIIVSHVMKDKDILYKTEKPLFYLSHTKFSYNEIHVHLPGIAESNLLIPKGTVVMLETDLHFDSKLDPYIEWYSGKKKFAEGKISEGAANIFWKAPEESGFYTIRAVIFPVENSRKLPGYQKEISLLVSSKSTDIHLISEDIPFKPDFQLANWYVFESNLNDSRKLVPAEQADADQIRSERSLKQVKNTPLWKASNGTYGAATGSDNIISLPKILISDKARENWQLLFRFKPENDGGLFSIRYGNNNDLFLHLYIENSNLLLSLTSPADTAAQIYSMQKNPPEDTAEADVLPSQASGVPVQESADDEEAPIILSEETAEPESSQIIGNSWGGDGSFVTAGIIFSVQPGSISAKLNYLGDKTNNMSDIKPITIKSEIKNEFQIILGFLKENKKPDNSSQMSGTSEKASEQSTAVKNELTAIWDEFALYKAPQTEDISVTTNQESGEEQPIASQTAESINSEIIS